MCKRLRRACKDKAKKYENQRFSTLNSRLRYKQKRGTMRFIIPHSFFIWVCLNTKPGRMDLEQKSLADEREPYKRTASEETRIE